VVRQSGTSVTGTLTLRDTRSGIAGQGTVSGSLTGSTLSFTMSIPAGGFPSPYSSCTATLSGTANNVTSAAIAGSYSGNNSCGGAVTGGTLSLTKQ
jgi:hypothetical protein